jgi:DNA-binding transcriptional regulator YhcF (GntR family)
MEFYIEENSSTPVIKQIEEQIKFAVMMGIFRNGDTLPSIRDVEKQTGVHHSQIHKAYLALRRSGLLVLKRGKGSVISTAAHLPQAISERCSKLSKQVTLKACQMGVSPTAFARYLSRYAQQSERKSPLILYADDHEEIVARTAAEISELWQVPVKGITFKDLKATVARRDGGIRRVLVNHVMHDYVNSMLSGLKVTVIPVKVHVAAQTIKLLGEIGANASVLLLHVPNPAHRIRYIIAQIQGFIKSPGVEISSISIRKVPDLGALLNSARYDYYVVGPAVRGLIPHDLRRNSRVLPIDPQLDPESLEFARISAGVVI